MRQSRYDFSKVLREGLFLLLLVLFFLLNLFFYWNGQDVNRSLWDNLQEYQSMEEEYRSMPPQEAFAEVTKETEHIGAVGSLMNFDTLGNYEDIFLELQQQYPDAYAEYMAFYKDHPEEIRKKSVFLSELQTQLRHIVNYPSFLEGIQAQAESMGKISIFNKPGTFSYRNILKTAEDYLPLTDVSLQLGMEKGIDSALRFSTTDLFVLVLVFLVCVYLFWNEKEKGLFFLTKSCVNGRGKSYLSRMAVLFLLCAAIVLVFYGSVLTAANSLYGLGDMNRMVQSMPSFADCTIPMTVGQFLVLYLVVKLCGILLFAWIFVFLFTLCPSSGEAYLLAALFLGGSYAAFLWIPRFSVWNPLKYLNFFAILDVKNLFRQYNNLNFFGFPIDRPTATLLVVISAMAVLFFLSYRFFVAETRVGKNRIVEKVMAWIRRAVSVFSRSVSLFYHESYKLYISGKMLLLLLAVLLLAAQNRITVEPEYSRNDAYYLGYMQEFAGQITPEKDQAFTELQESFAQLPLRTAELAQQLSEGKITKAEYEYETFRLNKESEKEEAFQRFEMQYLRVQNLRAEGVDAGIVSEISSAYLFSDPERDYLNTIFFLVLLILTVSSLFCREYRNKNISLIGATANGKGRLYAAKYGNLMVINILLLAALQFPQYWNAAQYYPIPDLSISIQSISQMRFVPASMSIGQFILLGWLFQILSIAAAVLLVQLICTLLKKYAVTMLVSAAVLLLPVFLELQGVLPIRFMGFSGGFLLTNAMQSPNSGVTVWSTLILLVLIGGISAVLSLKKFCGWHRKGGGKR